MKEVILGLLTRAAHVLQKRSHVPLPVIHFWKKKLCLKLNKRETTITAQYSSQTINYAVILISNTEIQHPSDGNTAACIWRQKLHDSLFTFPWLVQVAGKGHDRTRHSAVTNLSEREKNSRGRGRITCPLIPARIQKRTRRKVYGNSVCEVSVARRGFPAARRRDRNRSAWRTARLNALCVAPPRASLARAPQALMAPSRSLCPAPHASHGRPRFPAAAPSMAATWPYLSGDVRSPAPNMNYHEQHPTINKNHSRWPPKLKIFWST